MLKEKLAQLKKEEAKIRQEINQIIEKVQIPRLKKMVGQCFAYRNDCYSCPKKKSDYWNAFRKIIDYVENKGRGFYFIYEEFFINSKGIIKWEINYHSPYLNKEWWNCEVPFSSYEKITEKEYNSEKIKMIEEMGTQKKMRKVLNSKWD